MNETMMLYFDTDARELIADELGSMHVFYDRLRRLVGQESENRAFLSESTEESTAGASSRGGELVEISSAAAGLIAALSPVVIAWIRSRGFEVEEKIENRKSGTVIHTVRVRRGAMR